MHIHFKGEAEWLALRDSHIGGSDVAALFNLWRRPDGSEVVRHLYEAIGEHDVCLGSLSPYKTGARLYMEKAGRLAPDDMAENQRILAGQFLEPGIAAWGNKRWPDWKLKKSHVYHVSDDTKGMGASLDYFDGRRRPIDIKNVDGWVFRQKWVVDEQTGEIVDLPFSIVLQIQHQIACFGGDEGGVLACVGGNELARGFMPRHEPTISKIKTAVNAFWAAVDMGLEPPEADYGTIAEAYAFGESKDNATTALDYKDDEDANRELRRFLRWDRHKKFVENHVELLKGRVAQRLATNYKAEFADHIVTWPTIHRPAKEVSYTLKESTYRGGMRVTAIKEKKAKK